MTQLEFFFLTFLLFLICSGFVVIGAYFPGQKMWIKYTKNIYNFFNLKNIPFIIKEYKYKYITWFVLFSLVNCLALGMFLWIWFIVTRDIYQSENVLLFFLFILTFLISNTLIAILFKKFWNEIKKIGFYSKAEAITEFKKLQLEKKHADLKKFQIIKDNHNTIQNYPFQFQQRIIQKKINKLNKKKIDQNAYNLKLLNLFIKYLKIYAIFLIRIETNQYNVVDENFEKLENLNNFPDILINNFFAYAHK